jgi:hypothetical protein
MKALRCNMLQSSWWAVTDSNRRPSRCKRDALPAELTALAQALPPRCARWQDGHAGTLSIRETVARMSDAKSGADLAASDPHFASLNAGQTKAAAEGRR